MAQVDVLIGWLNDAYALEQAEERMLQRFIGDFEGYVNIQPHLQRYLVETKKQAADVKTCIESLDAHVSSAKSVLGHIAGTIQGIGTSLYKDEPVKDMLLLHAAGHLGHASYTAIALSAETCGVSNIADVCTALALEERAMAEWAERQLPEVVGEALERKR